MINTTASFHDKAKGQVIAPIADLFVSFTKYYEGYMDFFILDQSELNMGLLAPRDGEGVIQEWDRYDYTNYSDRLVEMDVERSYQFPFNMQMAMADFTVDNYDGYFTPDSSSPISSFNLPGRPVKLYAGFGGEEVLPQFSGLTQKMPTVESNKGLASYHAVDFLSEIAEKSLTDVVDMRDVRTDQVLAIIVRQFGLTSGQFDFEHGDNIIPFVFFDIGQNAGEAMQKLVQAENGKLWMDGTGMLHFRKRAAGEGFPIYQMNEYQIVKTTPGSYSDIVNHIFISCDLREVQEFQTVYSKTPKGESADTNWVIGPNASITRSLSLEDPCYSVVDPTQGRASSVSWFTAVDANGDDVPTGITATGQLTNNAYIVTLYNSNNFAVEINGMTLWGEPAKVYDHLDYESYEDESVEKYGDHKMTIADNQFFQSYEQAVSFSDSVLNERAFYNGTMNMQIKGDFSLELGDVFEITEGEHAGNYKIDGIKYHLEAGLLETSIDVHKVPHFEPFILDVSRLDDIYVLA